MRIAGVRPPLPIPQRLRGGQVLPSLVPDSEAGSLYHYPWKTLSVHVEWQELPGLV